MTNTEKSYGGQDFNISGKRKTLALKEVKLLQTPHKQGIKTYNRLYVKEFISISCIPQNIKVILFPLQR